MCHLPLCLFIQSSHVSWHKSMGSYLFLRKTYFNSDCMILCLCWTWKVEAQHLSWKHSWHALFADNMMETITSMSYNDPTIMWHFRLWVSLLGVSITCVNHQSTSLTHFGSSEELRWGLKKKHVNILYMSRLIKVSLQVMCFFLFFSGIRWLVIALVKLCTQNNFSMSVGDEPAEVSYNR